MAKRGRPNHLKRLAAPKAVPITNKKEHKWIVNPSPGPHSKRAAVPLIVLLRDVIKLAETAREIQKMLAARKITVDGKVRTDADFPVGLMDVVSFADRTYIMAVDSKARLVPVKVDGANNKIMKVVGKNVIKGGKFMIMLHNGRAMPGDNNIKVGDSLLVSIPDFKMEKVLKLEKGAHCLIREGKHAGTVAKLEEIIERKEGRDFEAKLSVGGSEFITVAKYLFVVDSSFKGAS